MENIELRLDEMERRIRTPSFRKNKGLGNEVGYYIFDYPPDKELTVRERITYMEGKNNKNPDGFELAVFDLYDIIVDLLEHEGFVEQCSNFEKIRGMDYLVRVVGNLIQVNDNESQIINYIKEHTPPNAVIFLIGIGKCYPLLRSHNVLNNFHQVIDHIPVVMFYPGKYNGQELMLFSAIKDDNYYRAFPLVD
jgi:Domain of unknown function (DUF1788).